MDENDSRSLLQNILGFFARKPQTPPSQQASLRSQTLDAWVRADAYLQHESNDLAEVDPEQVSRTLRAFENLVEYDSNYETDDAQKDLHYTTAPYPNLRAVRGITQSSNKNLYHHPGSSLRISKRKRQNENALEELSRLENEAKKRRALPREEASINDEIDEPEADFSLLTRRHSMSLHRGLRAHWTCVCQKCSGLSVRLSLPQKKGARMETCFEVFFGVRSLLAFTLQEAKITVKEMQNDGTTNTSELSSTYLPDFAHICQSVTESLSQRNCLHLLFEDGLFKRLRPQPKTFGDSQSPCTVSLSALFERQQDLRGGSSVLPLKGKRILAVILAKALLPFLETPWVQPSFDHSNIQFFHPLQGGDLPDITKPFLDMDQVPIISGNTRNDGNNQVEPDGFQHLVHPNASVLALGILLCELHYCTPVETWQTDTKAVRTINSDYYTTLEILKNLEVDAGVDYYLAAKACLHWEYFPAGEPTSFESASVQRLFYQNVVKRLESEIFKAWRLRAEDLNSLSPQENELCWGMIGREVVRRRTSKPESPLENIQEAEVSLPPTSNMVPLRDTFQHPTERTRYLQNAGESNAQRLYFFDASHHTASVQEAGLSETWMDNLLSSIYHHVDSLNAAQIFTGPIKNDPTIPKPVRIAILDSGFDPQHPLLVGDHLQLDPRIKGVHSFAKGTQSQDMQDRIGHGTHALGLLLKVAPCAEVYIAKVASNETMDRDSYDSIAKAVNYAVTVWDVDIISMSFGIREYHEPMKAAISNALHRQILMFAAASNNGANLGRAFPAKYPGVFCIHSTDGNGNPSTFNPTADDKDVNFSLLGEHVRSHWPAGRNGHGDIVNVMSGTSVATPIAAGLAASILAFVRQQEQTLPAGDDLLGPWLKDVHAMDAVLKSMVRQRRGAGYDYITPHTLFDIESSRDEVYNKIGDIKKHMYK